MGTKFLINKFLINNFQQSWSKKIEVFQTRPALNQNQSPLYSPRVEGNLRTRLSKVFALKIFRVDKNVIVDGDCGGNLKLILSLKTSLFKD